MGDTICNFNTAPGKQPYELLVLGSNEVNIPDNKLLVSIPSAVHSHKPPLIGTVQYIFQDGRITLMLYKINIYF